MIEETRFYNRLKNLYFSLYEIEQELSAAQNSKRITISSYEYDELESLKSRQIDKTNTIKDLINEYQDQEVTR